METHRHGPAPYSHAVHQDRDERQADSRHSLVPGIGALSGKRRSSSHSAAPDNFVIPALRQSTGSNVRKRMSTAIRSAGLKARPRVFHNIRSSRQTELEERYPRKTVCEWMGNSEQVADQHYLQVRVEHFKKAAEGGSVETPRHFVLATKGGKSYLSHGSVAKHSPALNPTSPSRFGNTAFSAVSSQKFPLHFALDYFGGQFESEFFQEDLLVIGGF